MVLPDFHTTQILISHLHNETNERSSNPIIDDLGDKISLSILCARVISESCTRKIFHSGYRIITKHIFHAHYVLFIPNASALKALK